MKRIVFATGNENKLVEIREILEGLGYEVVSMKEAGINMDIVEDGDTFEENAVIKAKAVYNFILAASESGPMKGKHGKISIDKRAAIASWKDAIVLADDSGLEIDALNKEPGIYSARYMGHDTPYLIKNNNLIKRMENVAEADRTARFVCAIAAVFPDGRCETRTGVMEGKIAHQSAGKNGFGYDPIFYLPQFGRTSAEISPEQKNEISHRGQALRAIRELLMDEGTNEKVTE